LKRKKKEKNMHTKVSELSVEELKMIIESSIDKKIRELLADDDEKMEIRESVKERLRKQSINTAMGEKGIPLSHVVKELGI
jgi:hypothetical protein